MTYFWETVDTIAPGLGWPHFGPFHLAVLAVFLLLGYPVLLAVVFAVMYLLLRVLRRRTAVPAGK